MLRRSWEIKRRLILESNKRILRESTDGFVEKRKRTLKSQLNFVLK